jgi:hypothetical protein
MKRKKLPLLIIIFFFIVVGGLNYIIRGGHMVLSVEPKRTIIVDRNLQITTIISNTKEDVEPVVYLETAGGIDLPYTESIEGQYKALKPVLDFGKSGTIYQRDTNVLLALLKTILSFLLKISRP